MNVDQLFEEEAQSMGRDVDAVQHVALAGGGWCLVYRADADLPPDRRALQRRVAVYRADGTQVFSGIMESSIERTS